MIWNGLGFLHKSMARSTIGLGKRLISASTGPASKLIELMMVMHISACYVLAKLSRTMSIFAKVVKL